MCRPELSDEAVEQISKINHTAKTRKKTLRYFSFCEEF
jgi:hypothetical protein